MSDPDIYTREFQKEAVTGAYSNYPSFYSKTPRNGQEETTRVESRENVYSFNFVPMDAQSLEMLEIKDNVEWDIDFDTKPSSSEDAEGDVTSFFGDQFNDTLMGLPGDDKLVVSEGENELADPKGENKFAVPSDLSDSSWTFVPPPSLPVDETLKSDEREKQTQLYHFYEEYKDIIQEFDETKIDIEHGSVTVDNAKAILLSEFRITTIEGDRPFLVVLVDDGTTVMIIYQPDQGRVSMAHMIEFDKVDDSFFEFVEKSCSGGDLSQTQITICSNYYQDATPYHLHQCLEGVNLSNIKLYPLIMLLLKKGKLQLMCKRVRYITLSDSSLLLTL